MKQPVYLDNQATTPVDPAVLEAMLPYFQTEFGNAASITHVFGRRAEQAVNLARKQIADLIGANDPSEIIFTSGATESNNLAIRGIAQMYREKGNHIITTQVEHRASLDTCRYLETQGFEVTYLPVGSDGLIRMNDLNRAIKKETILITVIHAHNEIGVLQPVGEIGEVAKERNLFFHSDAVQAVGKVPFDVQKFKLHLVSISAHKMYGPKGIGALYVKRKNPRVRLEPIIHGGGHEGGLRSGTLNVPGIVGFGKACELAKKNLEGEAERLLKLREKLYEGFTKELEEVRVNGDLKKRLPGNLNVSFAYVEGGALLKELSEDIAVSSGSACTTGSLEPSYVLKALGIPEALEHASIRFGIGRFNTAEEIDFAIRRVVQIVKKQRESSPLYELHKNK